MKNISTNKLQNDLSKIIKEVEKDEVYQVSRYSKPVAYLISKNQFEELVAGSDCKKCVADLRKIANKVKR
jgi:prevent-host-death family protein